VKLSVALAALVLSTSAFAQKTVELVWPFSPASPHSNVVRSLADNANKSQNKYTFVFTHKPGAGGAIAVNYVIQPGDNIRVLTHTSSFWIRPSFFDEGKYDINAITPITFIYKGESLALISSKHKTLDEFKKQDKPNLGIIPGSITMLTASKISSSIKDNFNLIPYPGTPEISRDVLGKHLDAGIEFTALADALQPNINILGITGTRSVLGHKTFSSQGVKGLDDIFSSFFIGISKTADPAVVNEMTTILQAAAKGDNVKSIVENNLRAEYVQMNSEDTQKFFRQHTAVWNSILKK
jgi:tripartite-type tricarboxylate transporter receptor subunit TctC